MSLRKQHPDIFAELDRLSAFARAANIKIVMEKVEHPSESLSCVICGVEKHHHNWLMRDRRCTGTNCYSCWHGSVLLSVSLSVEVIEQSGAMEVFQLFSCRVRRGLGATDVPNK